jgi:diaminopimelate decarboxylase
MPTPFWPTRVRRALRQAHTPCFVFAAEPLATQALRLDTLLRHLPVRHWWSFKTLPLAPAIQSWLTPHRGLEVVSAFELQTALHLTPDPRQILVNGPAKHTWLPALSQPGLRVNFDSLTELPRLAVLAKKHQWQIGLRLNTPAELHPDFSHTTPPTRTQFGLLPEEIGPALHILHRRNLHPDILHFHLRTQIPSPHAYHQAINHALAQAAHHHWTPSILDIGGGLPAANTYTTDSAHHPFNAGFHPSALRPLVRDTLKSAPWLREIWMEHGRWLTAPAAVLALRILDIKEGRGLRTVIANGGRTLHAMVATWEHHRLTPLNPRPGPRQPTLVCGPTCMAFDHLGVHNLPTALRPDDVLLWHDAGAYQLPWETAFSHRLAAIVWTHGPQTTLVRSHLPPL